MKTIIGLLAALALTACATGGKMQQWVGHSEGELVSAFGTPQASYELTNGGRVLTWGYSWGAGPPCRQSYTLNTAGTVTGYSFQNCPSGSGRSQ